MRQARRLTGLLAAMCPRASCSAQPSPSRACYHTNQSEFALANGPSVSVVGNAFGMPFTLLVAEQPYVSECRTPIRTAFAGRIAALGEPPYIALIDRRLHEEGASHHHIPSEAGGLFLS